MIFLEVTGFVQQNCIIPAELHLAL